MSTDLTAWPPGVGRVVLSETDSTMAEAVRQAQHQPAPFWVLAKAQSAARGRRGREWVNPDGNFAATLLMRPGDAPDRLALRSFIAALALFDALVSLTGRAAPFALKWPNDVLLNGGKLAGILLETRAPDTLLIGVGVNLASAPAAEAVEVGAVAPVSVAGETGVALAPEDLLTPFAAAFADYEAQFVAYGFDPIRNAWLARAARLGAVITARTGAEEITGTFETVDGAGNLVLKTPSGPRAIAAAEVYF